ncbi:MAG TPA: response regulator, partial [Chitinophagaceae bacterium]
VSLFLLVISSAASYFSIRNLITSGGWVNHTHEVKLRTEEIISNLKDGETGSRGYLLTKDASFLEPYNGAYERTISSINALKDLIKDNPAQQSNCDTLELLVNKKFTLLQQSIDDAKLGLPVNPSILKVGRSYMENIRLLTKKMQSVEENLLAVRNEKLNRYTVYAPVIILIAAAMAIVITIIFYRRVRNDFKERLTLNEILEKKDKDIASRLQIIQNIAQQIVNGNYKVRVREEENDTLGSLSGSLNRMASSLDRSFTQLADNEWLQTGVAQLSNSLAGEKDVRALTSDTIHFIAQYTESDVGAAYILDDDGSLKLTATYALSEENLKMRIQPGEDLAGQSYSNKGLVQLHDIDDSLYASFTGGQLKPKSVIAFPIVFEGSVLGVIELGTIHSFTDIQLGYLKNISELIGVAINTSKNRMKLKELLEETQAQAEELQAQHRELENMNVELEAQAEKLQTSEEELKVQQEELLETNQALEERSQLLEEKNHLVAVSNLEIQKKAEELELSTRYKSEFLANMSHELRTPLNSILLLSRLLAENNNGNLNDEQVEYAQVIQSSGDGLLQLIDEILDLSKIESGKLELSYEKIAISEIIADMRMLFAPLARDKNISLVLFASEDVPLQIEIDKFRLEQILKNLISNALKFTARGTIQLKISLSTLYDGFINFSVKDTGIGIPADKQEAVFEAFQQADGSTKRNYGGTGLGLSISRQLARLLSGDISLSSEVNKGSEFILFVPLSKPQSETNDRNFQTATSTQIAVSQPGNDKLEENQFSQRLVLSKIPEEIADDRQNITKNDKLLLIVEDDTGFAKALLEFVHQKGYKGIVLVRGDQVMDIARNYQPTGILLDIQLPIKDGLQVLDQLKGHSATRHIPVHIMSSFELKKETLKKGAVDFINKPVIAEQMNTILEKIESALNTDRKKVLIVEDNTQHAKALAWFLSQNGITTETSPAIEDSVTSLMKHEVNCVILDMGIPGARSYDSLDIIKKNESLSNTPIIIFTGKSLSRPEEQRIRQYADSVIIKTAQSYQRILDEVSLFLHIVDQNDKKADGRGRKLSSLDNILKNKTVLVTDDDIRNIFALTKALEKHQMHVITTGNGKEALNVLKNNSSIDIVLMDMMMPEMDGYETITHIRKNNEWRRLPVIAVTAKAMTGDREKCIQAGASDYITKPVDTDQLISLMRIWIQETSK